jgi:MYXO-CTERM domain-containing protein
MENTPTESRERTTSDTAIKRRLGGGGGPRPFGVVILALLLITSTGVGAVAFGSGTASAQTGFSSGDVELDVFVPDNTFTPGRTAEMNLQVANDGEVNDGSSPDTTDLTTTARNVRVEVDEQRAPISVETGEKSIGSVGTETPREVPIEIDVPEDAEEGEYEIEVELEYRHTSRVFDRAGTQGDRTHTVTRDIDIEIDDAPRFDLTELETTAQVDDSGPTTAEIENVGGEPAEDLTVELTSTSQRVSFGDSPSETASVSSLAPGETATIRYDVRFGPRASERAYPFDATVTYEDLDGIPGTDSQPTLDVTPMAEQTFEITDTESTLRVGEEGDLMGTVTNTGPVAVDSVSVQYSDEYPNIVPIERDVAVGTLDPGESAAFRLPLEVTREADPVAKSVAMSVSYRSDENELNRYEDVDAFAEVAERRDQFLIDVEENEIPAGSERLINVTVTNNLDEPVSDVEAKLFTDSPIGAGDDDEAYAESLEPGESTTTSFRISADSGAAPRTYSVEMDFRYDDEDGTSKVSETYRAAIDVTESEDGGPSWLLIGGLLVVVALGAGALWRRRG